MADFIEKSLKKSFLSATLLLVNVWDIYLQNEIILTLSINWTRISIYEI